MATLNIGATTCSSPPARTRHVGASSVVLLAVSSSLQTFRVFTLWCCGFVCVSMGEPAAIVNIGGSDGDTSSGSRAGSAPHAMSRVADATSRLDSVAGASYNSLPSPGDEAEGVEGVGLQGGDKTCAGSAVSCGASAATAAAVSHSTGASVWGHLQGGVDETRVGSPAPAGGSGEGEPVARAAPPGEDQLAELRRHAKVPALGDSYYLVASRWMQRLRDHAAGEPPPGPIDNSELLEADGSLKGPRKIQEGVQFEVVSAAQWEALLRWHGIAHKRSVIERCVTKTAYRDPYVEIWPIEVSVLPASIENGEPRYESAQSVRLCGGDTPAEIVARTRHILFPELEDDSAEQRESRVYTRRPSISAAFHLVEAADVDDCVADMALPWESGMEILVEFKSIDGDWPRSSGQSSLAGTPSGRRGSTRSQGLVAAARRDPRTSPHRYSLTAGVKRDAPPSPASPAVAAHGIAGRVSKMGAVPRSLAESSGHCFPVRKRAHLSFDSAQPPRTHDSDSDRDEGRYAGDRVARGGAGDEGGVEASVPPAAGASVSAKQSAGNWRGLSSARHSWQVPARPVFPRGVTGLSNLGNTCFMNSALQCLSNTRPLRTFLTSGAFQDDINADNPLGTGGELAIKMAALMRRLWSGACDSVAPTQLKWALGRFAPQFSGYAQHDSQELLAFLLDGLHEDLNRVKDKPYVAGVEGGDDDDDRELASRSWQQHLRRNQSIIVDVFQGQYKSRVECPECKRVSVTFDPFMYLSLPVPSSDSKEVRVTVVSAGRSPQQINLPVPRRLARGKDVLLEACKLLGCSLPQVCLLEQFGGLGHDWKTVGPHTSIFGDEDLMLVQLESATDAAAFCETFAAVRRRYDDDVRPFLVEHRFCDDDDRGQPVVVGCPQPLLVKRSEDDSEVATGEHAVDDATTVATGPGGFSSINRRVDATNGWSPSGEVLLDLILAGSGLDVDRSDVQLQYKLPWRYTGKIWEDAVDDASPVDRESQCLRVVWPKRCFDALRQRYEPRPPDAGEDEGETAASVTSCLKDWGKAEQLGEDDMWYCSNCKDHRRAFKQLSLFRLPDVLVVHLKRFSYTEYSRDRIDTEVSYPVAGLDLAPFLDSTAEEQETVYDLFAVSNHIGGLGGGHYTAKALNAGDGRWYSFNDSVTSTTDAAEIVGPENYVLMFQRRSVTSRVYPWGDEVRDEASDAGASDGDSVSHAGAGAGAGGRPAAALGRPDDRGGRGEFAAGGAGGGAGNRRSAESEDEGEATDYLAELRAGNGASQMRWSGPHAPTWERCLSPSATGGARDSDDATDGTISRGASSRGAVSVARSAHTDGELPTDSDSTPLRRSPDEGKDSDGTPSLD